MDRWGSWLLVPGHVIQPEMRAVIYLVISVLWHDPGLQTMSAGITLAPCNVFIMKRFGSGLWPNEMVQNNRWISGSLTVVTSILPFESPPLCLLQFLPCIRFKILRAGPHPTFVHPAGHKQLFAFRGRLIDPGLRVGGIKMKPIYIHVNFLPFAAQKYPVSEMQENMVLSQNRCYLPS